MDLGDLLAVRGRDLLLVLPRVLAAANHGLRDDDPRVVVAEDARVLLVARRIGRDLAKLDLVLGERGVQQHDAVRRVEALAHGIERQDRLAVVEANSAHDAVTLRLDPDLRLVVLVGADDVPVEVVGAAEPRAIPAVVKNRLLHLVDGRLRTRGLRLVSTASGQSRRSPGRWLRTCRR